MLCCVSKKNVILFHCVLYMAEMAIKLYLPSLELGVLECALKCSGVLLMPYALCTLGPRLAAILCQISD